MMTNLKRILTLLLAVCMVAGFALPASAATGEVASIGSLMDSYAAANGSTYTLSASSRLFVVGSAAPVGELLQTAQLVQRQFAADGHTMQIVWGDESWAKAGDIVLKLTSGIAAEGYQMNVTDKAVVSASDADGLLYGMNMLQKMIRNAGTTISGFTAADAPDTRERTVQLDVARKYFTVDWICNFIRQMSWMGYNSLALHFSEDGGFRADLWDPAYYTDSFQPENDFSWICGSHIQSWVHGVFRNDPDAGKYLTTAELVKICNVAREYHIDIIPSFDSPSHMDYLTWKFEQNYKADNDYSFTYNDITYKAESTSGCINYRNITGDASPTWPYYTTIDITDGTMARAFVFALYEDVADFFKQYAGSTKFSVGSDEVNLSNSAVTWQYDKFPGYINDLNTLLRGKGYTMRMFNDFIKADYLDQFDDTIEILYWNSPFHTSKGTITEGNILPVIKLVADGRTLYNCIQTNTYFVLRVMTASNTSTDTTDARSADCKNWVFYHSDEDSIYDEWYPADISEHGDYSEDAADVPDAQLGGGYFLLWNDYAAVATESEVWNGYQNTGKWNVIDRMWSNTIKMWNSDVNSTVDYTTYAGIRAEFGCFPGYTSCSTDAYLPSTVDPNQAFAADHTALTAALETKLTNDGYTADSYTAYEAAYAEAQKVNENHGATAEEIQTAIDNLANAEKNLTKETAPEPTDPPETTEPTEPEEVPTTNVILLKTMAGGEEHLIRWQKLNVTSGTFAIYIAPVNGYRFASCQGASFTPLASGDGSGYIRGTATADAVITLWYDLEANTSRLEDLQEEEITEQGSYTKATWDTYTAALAAAKAFNVSGAKTQAEIDAVVKELQDAKTGLVQEIEGETQILSVEKLSGSVRLGKQVGLRVITTADVAALTVENQKLSLCVASTQTLTTGEAVKIWLVYWPAKTAGTAIYTLHANTAAATVEITIN